MQSACTLSLIMPSFASEVRTAIVGHLWRHSPFVFLFECLRVGVLGEIVHHLFFMVRCWLSSVTRFHTTIRVGVCL